MYHCYTNQMLNPENKHNKQNAELIKRNTISTRITF